MPRRAKAAAVASVSLALATTALGALGFPTWVWVAVLIVAAAGFVLAAVFYYTGQSTARDIDRPAAFETSEKGETVFEGGSVTGYPTVSKTWDGGIWFKDSIIRRRRRG